MKDSLRFRRIQRIKHRPEFDRLFTQGHKISGVYYTAFFIMRASEETLSRLGISLPRRLGNAVVRNQEKRRVREFFRTHQLALQGGWDILIYIRRAARPAAQLRDLEKIWHLLSSCSASGG